MTALVVRSIVCVAFVALACGVSSAGALLEPKPAPDWQVSEWLNDNPGSLSAHRGKVVLIEFFQLWCPGCQGFSMPLFESWHETYGGRDDMLVVSIHTVFEGHEQQSPEKLRAFVRGRGIDHPVGIDAYETPASRTPITMDRFETEGTPHIVIVDKQGQLVFSHFGRFERGPVEAFIERLLKAKSGAGDGSTTMRAGEKRKQRSAPAASAPPRRPRQVRTPPPKPRSRAGSEQDDTSEDGEQALDRELSGTYRISFEQSDKSCGTPIPPLTLLADLIAQGDQLEIRVRRPFLGLSKIPGTINVDTGDFRASTTAQAREGGAVIELALELNGSVDADASPPSVNYEFALEKSGPTPDWECLVEGRGEGERTTGAR